MRDAVAHAPSLTPTGAEIAGLPGRLLVAATPEEAVRCAVESVVRS
jgi:hypothetical protein